VAARRHRADEHAGVDRVILHYGRDRRGVAPPLKDSSVDREHTDIEIARTHLAQELVETVGAPGVPSCDGHRRPGGVDVGITGAPAPANPRYRSALARDAGACDLDVGVLAIDPTSPSAVARSSAIASVCRITRSTTGVFIRSMATRATRWSRGSRTPQALRVLDAAGKEWIVIETVGVGQVEVRSRDTRIPRCGGEPRLGDAVQAAKAGLLEIADLFVVNKADRPGTDETARDLDGMLELAGELEMATAGAEDGCHRRKPASPSCGTRCRAHREYLEQNGLVEERRATVCATSCARSSPNSCASKRPRWVPVRDSTRSSRQLRPARLIRSPPRPSCSAEPATPTQWFHPLAVILDEAAHGRFPEPTAAVHVVPSLPGGLDALLSFTGTFVLAADVAQEEVDARVPVGEFSIPISTTFVSWLEQQLGAACGHPRRRAGHAVARPRARVRRADRGRRLGAPARESRAALPARCARRTSRRRPRRRRARPGNYGTLEIAFEVDDTARGAGFGRALAHRECDCFRGHAGVGAGRARNAASMRAVIAAGFRPVGAETLLVREPG